LLTRAFNVSKNCWKIIIIHDNFNALRRGFIKIFQLLGKLPYHIRRKIFVSGLKQKHHTTMSECSVTEPKWNRTITRQIQNGIKQLHDKSKMESNNYTTNPNGIEQLHDKPKWNRTTTRQAQMESNNYTTNPKWNRTTTRQIQNGIKQLHDKPKWNRTTTRQICCTLNSQATNDSLQDSTNQAGK